MELNFDPSRGERQLFLDASGIARMDDLVRTMHQPIKKGAVIRPDLDAGQFCLQIRTAPIWDPEAQLFKLWDGGARRESSDGYHWKVVAPHEGPCRRSLRRLRSGSAVALQSLCTSRAGRITRWYKLVKAAASAGAQLRRAQFLI